MVTTSLAQCLVHIFLDVFLCNNLSYRLLGAWFLEGLSLQKPLLHTLVHVSWARSFTTNSLVQLLVARFWAPFFVRTFLAHCLEHVFWSSFFQTTYGTIFGIVPLQHPLLHNFWCTFWGIFLLNHLSYTLFGARFLGVFLCKNVSGTLWCTLPRRVNFATNPLVHGSLHVLVCFLCKNHSCTLLGARFFRIYLCSNLSWTLYGVRFWSSFFATTSLAHFLVYVLLGVSLCNNLVCTLI